MLSFRTNTRLFIRIQNISRFTQAHSINGTPRRTPHVTITRCSTISRKITVVADGTKTVSCNSIVAFAVCTKAGGAVYVRSVRKDKGEKEGEGEEGEVGEAGEGEGEEGEEEETRRSGRRERGG